LWPRLFAVHPLHVESVAWVAERKDVLCAFFFMLTAIAYVRYVRAPSAGRYVLVAIGLACGLMAKPMIVHDADGAAFARLLAPGSISAWYRRTRAGKSAAVRDRRRVQRVTFVAQRPWRRREDPDPDAGGPALQNAIVSYVDYLAQTIWPANMGVFYPFRDPYRRRAVAMSALILLGITGLAWALRRAHRTRWWVVVVSRHAGARERHCRSRRPGRADRFTYLP
jgi:hypothetical protein